MYRARAGRAALYAPEREDEEGDGQQLRDSSLARGGTDPRDYDVPYYLRLLRDTFASRLERALSPLDYEAVVADPAQLSLFARSLEQARPILTVLRSP